MYGIRAAREDDLAAVCRLRVESAPVHEDLAPAKLDPFVVILAGGEVSALAVVVPEQTALRHAICCVFSPGQPSRFSTTERCRLTH